MTMHKVQHHYHAGSQRQEVRSTWDNVQPTSINRTTVFKAVQLASDRCRDSKEVNTESDNCRDNVVCKEM